MCALMVQQTSQAAAVEEEEEEQEVEDLQADVPIGAQTFNPNQHGFLGPETGVVVANSSNFISKTPSPQSANFTHHFTLYMSKSQDGDAGMYEIDTERELESGTIECSSSERPLSRSNSRKKRGSLANSAWYGTG